MAEHHNLILASASPARRALLTGAGLPFDVIPADIDEDAVKSALLSVDPLLAPARLAEELAAEKARAVARQHPGKLVIGADQVLAFEGAIFSKCATEMEARALLKKLRGRTHELISAAALSRDGVVLWSGSDHARLAMREFTDVYLAAYLKDAGPAILACVGCYELEGRGAHLFDKIDGDYFTILGLPLIPLLGALRRAGALET